MRSDNEEEKIFTEENATSHFSKISYSNHEPIEEPSSEEQYEKAPPISCLMIQPKSIFHPSFDDSIINDQTKRPKSNDPAWKYSYMPDRSKVNYVVCLLCTWRSTGGIGRFKGHIIGGDRNAPKCPNTTLAIIREIAAFQKEKMKNRRKTSANIGLYENIINVLDVFNESKKKATMKRKRTITSAIGSSSGSFDPVRLKRSESNDFVWDNSNSKLKQTVLEKTLKKEEKEIVDNFAADFFFTSRIPFNVINNTTLDVWLEAVGRYGRGYKCPPVHELKGKLLDRQVTNVDEMRKKHEQMWKLEGCTLMSDEWMDVHGRSIINFFVNSSAGSFYLTSIDTSYIKKTDCYIVSILEEVVEEIGPENVVQVCTNNAANYIGAGNKLMVKYEHLFWTPCVAHFINLILEDIGNIPRMERVISTARKITSFIYFHSTLHSEFLKQSKNKELVRCGGTRFVTSFLTLQSLNENRENLENIDLQPWASSDGATLIERAILDGEFWVGVDECIKASQPLVEILRMVEADQKPCMAYISDTYQKAREAITLHFANNKTTLKFITDILDKRCGKYFCRPLFGACAFLNPKLYYVGKDAGDPLIHKYEMDFHSCLTRMVGDRDVKMTIISDVQKYKNRMEYFAMDLATSSIGTLEPLKWWDSFGIATPKLMNMAKRILSLSCTSSSCERNWSTFDFIHTKKGNRLESERLGKVLYINYNKRLHQRYQNYKLYNNTSNFDPICVDELNSNSEWITGIIGPSNEFVYREEGLIWVEIKEPVELFTRSRQQHSYVRRQSDEDNETKVLEYGGNFFDALQDVD